MTVLTDEARRQLRRLAQDCADDPEWADNPEWWGGPLAILAAQTVPLLVPDHADPMADFALLVAATEEYRAFDGNEVDWCERHELGTSNEAIANVRKLLTEDVDWLLDILTGSKP